MPKGGLGLGLGLNKKQIQAWSAAPSRADWLGTHRQVARRVENRIQAGSPRETKLQQFIAGGGPSGAPPPTAAPAPTAPPATPTPDVGKPTLGDIAEKYNINLPPELKTVSDFAAGNLPKVGQWDQSRYEEQFNRLMEQSNREADVQAAGLREAYGSMGARYGSDLTEAERKMRKDTTLDLMTKGFDVRQSLNQQRLQELAGTVGALQTVGASKANISTSGMDRAWQDYLMQMQPPSQWDEMMGYATSFNPPGTVVY